MKCLKKSTLFVVALVAALALSSYQETIRKRTAEQDHEGNWMYISVLVEKEKQEKAAVCYFLYGKMYRFLKKIKDLETYIEQLHLTLVGPQKRDSNKKMTPTIKFNVNPPNVDKSKEVVFEARILRRQLEGCMYLEDRIRDIGNRIIKKQEMFS